MGSIISAESSVRLAVPLERGGAKPFQQLVSSIVLFALLLGEEIRLLLFNKEVGQQRNYFVILRQAFDLTLRACPVSTFLGCEERHPLLAVSQVPVVSHGAHGIQTG